MHPEIENLINMALADGEVTEKKRAIIMRKAEALGEDKDEVELILDGRIALYKKEQSKLQPSINPKSNKEGDLKKCPSCGAPVQSFSTKCSECGHEFRNIEAEKTISDLFNLLQEHHNNRNNYSDDYDFTDKEVSLISTFPIPNSKEAIIEFLSQSFSKAYTGSKWSWLNENDFQLAIRKAWKKKCTEIIIKARFSMKDDKEALDVIMQYAKEIGIK